jgi:hypothetical protein
VKKLENWRIITQYTFNDQNPDEPDDILIIHGKVDGEWILTDELIIFDVFNRVVTTKGRYSYKLGMTAIS